MVRSRWFRAFCAVNLAMIFAVALWFRTTSLAMRCPNGDETFYGVQVANLLGGEGVASTTASGNMLNYLVVLAEIPTYLVLGPTDLTLMIPAAVAGILAVVIALALLPRGLDRTTAVIAATLTAVLPIAIIEGRVGAEPAWNLPVGMLALAAAFRGHRLGTLVAFLLCYYVHPTYLFLIPALGLVLTAKVWERTAGEPRRRLRELVATALGAASVVAPLTLLTSDRSAIRWTYETYDFGPGNWPLYFLYFERMLMGFCEWGPQETTRAFDATFWGVALAVLLVGGWRLWAQRHWDRLALIAGLAISLAGMHLVTGPDILRPYLVRYGLYLVAPTVVAFACLLSAALVEPAGRLRDALRYGQAAAFFGLAWALLICVKVNFFGFFLPQLAGQEDFWTLRTEAVDPKQWVASIIAEDIDDAAGPGVARVVLAEDWWTYRPIQYYLFNRDDVVPGSLEHFDGPMRDRLIRKHLDAGGYVVGTFGEDVIERVESAYPEEDLKHWHVFGPPYACLAIYRLKRQNEGREAQPIALLKPEGVDWEPVLR